MLRNQIPEKALIVDLGIPPLPSQNPLPALAFHQQNQFFVIVQDQLKKLKRMSPLKPLPHQKNCNQQGKTSKQERKYVPENTPLRAWSLVLQYLQGLQWSAL